VLRRCQGPSQPPPPAWSGLEDRPGRSRVDRAGPNRPDARETPEERRKPAGKRGLKAGRSREGGDTQGRSPLFISPLRREGQEGLSWRCNASVRRSRGRLPRRYSISAFADSHLCVDNWARCLRIVDAPGRHLERRKTVAPIIPMRRSGPGMERPPCPPSSASAVPTATSYPSGCGAMLSGINIGPRGSMLGLNAAGARW
jgi:hypothetical protein